MNAPENLRIIFVRHPQTEWQNVKDPESSKAGQRLLGRTDVALSQNGLAQAQRLAKNLVHEKVTKIESSPLTRALTTAQVIAEAIDISAITRPNLREIDFGACEGLTFESLAENFPTVHQAYLAQGAEVIFPEGESFSQFQARVIDWLAALLTKNNNETVVVVTHGGVIRVALCHLLGWPIEKFWHIRQDYGGITTIGIYGNKTIIERINSQTGGLS